jgi:spoIIIJ-associated protein
LDDVEITVLNEGRGGILGLGAEDARINVKLLKPEKGNEDESVTEASKVLQKMLSLLGVQASVEISSSQLVNEDGDSNPVVLNIVGEDAGSLIGRRGQTLDAIQYLVRLITAKQNRPRTPVMIDIQEYKKRHYEDLRTMALNVASQVKTHKSSIRLEPMSAFERRIVHMALAKDPEVTTESIGEGEMRKVVVYPKSRK